MKAKKALLISLQCDLDTIGIKYIHYNLLEHGYDSSILYLTGFSKDNPTQLKNVKQFIQENEPDLIGFSLMGVEYYITCDLTRFIKSFAKHIPIVWGGIHPTISPDSCVDVCDFACIGEGEKTIVEMMDVIKTNGDLRIVNNLAYMHNGNMKKNVMHPLMTRLEDVPAYEHIPSNSFIHTKKDIIPLDKRAFEQYAR